MSLQTIVNNATYIDFKQAKLAGQSISRSGRILTATVASAEPFRMDVGMHEGLTYSTNRGLAQSINNLDITVEEAINIGSSNSGLAYITQYMGDVPPADVNLMTFTSINNNNPNQFAINTSAISPVAFVFRKGDIISFAGAYRYPYIVTGDVAWDYSNPSAVVVGVHRNFINQDGYTESGASLRAGVDCTWTVKMVKKPNYSVLPGDRLVFNGNKFELAEIIRKEDG